MGRGAGNDAPGLSTCPWPSQAGQGPCCFCTRTNIRPPGEGPALARPGVRRAVSTSPDRARGALCSPHAVWRGAERAKRVSSVDARLPYSSEYQQVTASSFNGPAFAPNLPRALQRCRLMVRLSSSKDVSGRPRTGASSNRRRCLQRYRCVPAEPVHFSPEGER